MIVITTNTRPSSSSIIQVILKCLIIFREIAVISSCPQWTIKIPKETTLTHTTIPPVHDTLFYMTNLL